MSMKERVVGFLRWTEQYTKTDMVYLTKGGFWLGLGQSVGTLSGLILAVAFANLLPKETYGTYQFVMSVAAILGSFTLSGMATAVTKAVAQGHEGALRYGARTQLRWSIGITIAASFVALYYFLNGNSVLGASFLIVGCFSPFLESFRLYSAYLSGKKLFRESTMLGFWRKPLPLVAMLVALAFTQDPMLLVLTYFASNTISVALMYRLVISRYRPPLGDAPELAEYSKHLSVIGFIGMLGGNLDKLLIFHFLGAAPVAAYILAQMPVAQLRQVFALVQQMTLPKLSNRTLDELKASLPHKARIHLFGTVLAVGAYILAAPYIFAFFFPTYPEAILYTQALALSVLSMPRGFYVQAFTALELKKEVYWSRLSLPALNTAMLLFLLPLYGIWGAIISLLASHLITNALIRYLFARARPERDNAGPRDARPLSQ